MTDPIHARAFLLAEVEALAPFAFLLVGPSGRPLHTVRVMRGEDGSLAVSVPGRPRGLPELEAAQRSALQERGFAQETPTDSTRPWVHAASDAASAVGLAQQVLSEVFGEKPDADLDIVHGDHRAAHEAEQKLASLRERIAKAVASFSGQAPTRDADGDFVMAMGDVHVTVAPRAMPGGPVVVRVFAITNVGVNVTPELGLFLARLNFGLMFGRFALDTDNRAIWFDESLLGDQFRDEELRFTIGVVASTADEWDDRLKQMFGGVTYQQALLQHRGDETPPVKPGNSGYL